MAALEPAADFLPLTAFRGPAGRAFLRFLRAGAGWAKRVPWPTRRAREILEQPAFAEFSSGELSPGLDVGSDDAILEWVRRDAETALHPSCTCRMGVDPAAVTDPASLRVHGVEGLRVIDASVMPSITNGNTYAPVMMIAEKASDMIRGRPALAPVEGVAA